MEIGSQKPEIPERIGDIKKKTDTLSKLSVLVRRGRVLSYATGGFGPCVNGVIEGD